MIKKLILRYIQKQGSDDKFMEDMLLACHIARQSIPDDRAAFCGICPTALSRIYDVFKDCTKAIPKIVPQWVINDPEWRKLVAKGIDDIVRKELQL